MRSRAQSDVSKEHYVEVINLRNEIGEIQNQIAQMQRRVVNLQVALGFRLLRAALELDEVRDGDHRHHHRSNDPRLEP